MVDEANVEEVTGNSSMHENTAPPPVQPILQGGILAKLILCSALFFPLFLASLDTTIVATAIPHIASSFNQLNGQTWIANAYLLTNTAFLPAYGQLADIFGRHIVIQSAIFIFLVGSALCTGAQTWGMMLAGRGIAGIGAAGCFVLTRIIMSDTESLRENSTQNTFLALMFAIAYSIGPVLGGVLTAVSWRWCFAINLPVCIVAHIMIFALLRNRVRASTYDSANERHSLSFKLKKVDYTGIVLFLGAWICIIFALVSGGSQYPWKSGRIIAPLVVGAILLALFFLVEWLFEKEDSTHAPSGLRPAFRHATPMIPLEIFRDWDVCICQWINFASGMVMFGQFYYIAIYFTIVFSFSPQNAGKQLLYFLPGIGAGMWCAIFFILRAYRGTKFILIAGNVIMTVATGLFSMAVKDKIKPQLYGFMAMLGFGVGLLLMPAQLHSQARMMRHLAIVTSIVTFFRCLGGIFAITIMSSVVNNKLSAALSSHFPHGLVSSSLNSLGTIQSLPPALLILVQNAFSDAIRWAYISLLPFVSISAIGTLFLREVRIEKPPVQQAKSPSKEKREDIELGNVERENTEATHPPRIKIYGPIGLVIWCIQAIGDKLGWRK